jgi:hypothetical protein
MLVVYPADGYWRPKPLPPPALPDTAYGSSFLFGPIEVDESPASCASGASRFDPADADASFSTFRDGTRTGMLTVAGATPSSLTARPDVSTRRAPNGRPFAALRSMYVTPEQADVSIAHWRPIAGHGRHADPRIRSGRMRPRCASGGSNPSRHNLSAPDLVFEEFATSTSR